MKKVKNKISSLGTVKTFLTSDKACSGTLFSVINNAYGHPMSDEERASMPFAGGIMQHGYQCGMVWGAVLAAGAQSYRLFGSGTKAETNAILAAQRLVESFISCAKHLNCLEITDIDKTSSNMKMVTYFLLQGGTIHCCLLASRYAPIAFNDINKTLSFEQDVPTQESISCSAMLAKKLGLSEEHVTMVAGFAGGIGLSGGGCGALGAAIWILGMNSLKSGADKLNFKDPKAFDLIDSFMKCSDYEFECSKIVGRKFESIEDHANYICNGGCSEIIEALANSCKNI